MLSNPDVMPKTSPKLEINALPLLALHKPAATVSVSVMISPIHTESGPVIMPADGIGLIVITLAKTVVPQLFKTVYVIVSKPAMTPKTTPVLETNALLLLAFHVPKTTVSDS